MELEDVFALVSLKEFHSAFERRPELLNFVEGGVYAGKDDDPPVSSRKFETRVRLLNQSV